MPRKRFSKDERDLIATAGNGGRVQWQNVTQWHDATITDATIQTDDGWQFITGINRGSTKTISAGKPIRITPGHIRAIPFP